MMKSYRLLLSFFLILLTISVAFATEQGVGEPFLPMEESRAAVDLNPMETVEEYSMAVSPAVEEEAEGFLPEPEQIIKTGPFLWYGSSRTDGFLVSFDAGVTWEPRNEGLPRKAFTDRETIRTITALGVDPVHPARVAVTTSDQVYLSEDYGASWRLIPFNNGSVLTAVALSPFNEAQLLVGTSFAGFYETSNSGQSWTKLSRNLSFLRQGTYEEEIAALAYHPENQDKLLFACGFGNGLYLYNKALNIWEKLATDQNNRALIKNLFFLRENLPGTDGTTDQPGWWLRVTYESETEVYTWPAFKLLAVTTDGYRGRIDPAQEGRMARAANKYGIYIRSDFASGQRLENHLRFIRENGLNAMVVDFKDDQGYITYDTQVSLARQIGAVRKRFNVKELIKKAKENNIYLIGRLVVFKDSCLYRYDHHKYAIWDQNRNEPWRHLVAEKTASGETTYVQKEHWVDPYASDVWAYNVALAKELEALGVDEIQFDYIRFPTDGDLSRCDYRHQPAGAQKIDALEGFLAMARNQLTVPISTDLYGFHCWYQWEGLTGQNIRVFAQYVDVICPMYYPSHFPASFYPGEYLERAGFIYQEGSFRANAMTAGESIIRPYVQAFLLTGRELRMTKPVYSEYLLKQVTGTLASPASGFTLWNNSNRYYMVTKSLTEHLEAANKNYHIR